MPLSNALQKIYAQWLLLYRHHMPRTTRSPWCTEVHGCHQGQLCPQPRRPWACPPPEDRHCSAGDRGHLPQAVHVVAPRMALMGTFGRIWFRAPLRSPGIARPFESNCLALNIQKWKSTQNYYPPLCQSCICQQTDYKCDYRGTIVVHLRVGYFSFEDCKHCGFNLCMKYACYWL